ncbi:hypothetical protein VAB18032_16100 [Micromonospora maris AB-18-032]|uniref:Uncharacterized protein n=1 Tax=Micromonospora maris TaxID=1003110 RepID=A0A9X0HZ91_9ACTN|nr:hypothetical protein VAB18032_16100 [Micromonospora maris AB-18-032]KUJ43863.1 hypothetical protein ADL17_11405 [Micromonospora maris]
MPRVPFRPVTSPQIRLSDHVAAMRIGAQARPNARRWPVRPKRKRDAASTHGWGGRHQVINLPELIIEAPMPFEPQVSHPEAKRYVEGKGRIEGSDLKAFGIGMVNAVKPGQELPVDPYNQRAEWYGRGFAEAMAGQVAGGGVAWVAGKVAGKVIPAVRGAQRAAGAGAGQAVGKGTGAAADFVPDVYVGALKRWKVTPGQTYRGVTRRIRREVRDWSRKWGTMDGPATSGRVHAGHQPGGSHVFTPPGQTTRVGAQTARGNLSSAAAEARAAAFRRQWNANNPNGPQLPVRPK